MKSLLLKTTYVILAISVSIPAVGYAAELRLDASKVEVRDGDELMVSAILYADGAVNAVEGRISFPDNLLAVQEIRDGNSSINFWIEKPHIESAGTLIFSGITPGGFKGVSNHIFSVIFRVKQEGTATISIAQAKALQNDGAGTEVSLALRNVVVNIKAGDSGIRKHAIEDVAPPEPFTPIITHDPSLFEGKSFVVFATQDKGSGIKHYEVREGRFGWWKEAKSPYLLVHQELNKDIYVKAIDHTGNERIAVVPAAHRNWWEEAGLFAILTVIILFALAYKKTWLRFTK